MKNNPYLSQIQYEAIDKKVIYIAPNDLREKLSGGHLEAITDAILLSEVYEKVILIFPNEKIKRANNLFLDTIRNYKNITYKCVNKNNNLLGKLFLSERRASYKEIVKFINKEKNSDIFIGCHRNLLAHIFIYKNFGSSRIFFKSYGSIFLHNLDNIYAILKTRCIEPLFLNRLLSMIFYFIFEHLSYVFCNKIFITRDISNVRMNLFGRIFHRIYHNKVIYNASGPYWSFEKSNQNESYKFKGNKSKKNILFIGSLGDNTFPTAILGMIYLLNKIDKANIKLNFELNIKVAGKNNHKFKKIIMTQNFSSNIMIEFLGYVETKEEFIGSLEGMLLPVSGGSAMPIKAIESMLKYKGPILVTKYINDSCSGFFKDNDNIFFDAEKYLLYLKNLKLNS